jgi:prepilin-type N-terminal cleavage/methylation domain-containing protein
MRARSERGFTLVEVLVAMTLMSVGVAATLSVFGSAGRTTVIAQQNDVAVQQAQAAIDQISTMSYSKVGLTSTPSSSASPKNPGYRVSGSTLLIKTGLSETFVLSTDTGQSQAAVNPAPSTFAVGSGNGTISGKVYRYVTWRDENCQSGVCDGSQNTKRITVAVTIDAYGTIPVMNPVWVSEVLPDPSALPPGSNSSGSSSSGGNPISAQNFYLYDTRCGQSTRQTLTADNATHNTASFGYAPNWTVTDFSTCETSNTAMQPDLMGKTVPPGNNSTPLFTYSTDLAGTYDGGLAMKKGVTACPKYYYDVRDTSNTTGASPNVSSGANKWSLHSWSSPAFSTNFGINGQATVSLFTSTVGGVAAKGVLCATVSDRSVFPYNGSYYPIDRVIGSTTYTLNNWPTATRRITFTFALPDDTDVVAGHRIVLTLAVMSDSTSDLNFLYDHPLYPSLLEVATDTPY